MAYLTGRAQIFEADTSTVDSTKQYALGTRAFDASGNEYIYLQGVANTTAKLAVTYDENYLTTLTVANAVGCVAIAMAATVADTYGWYMIKGTATATANDTVAADKQLYLTAGAGKLDDADVAGDAIIGAISRSTGTAAGDLTIQINYPFVCDAAID